MEHQEIDSLYTVLGKEKIKKLVDSFYGFVYQDPEIAPLFKGDIEVIKEKQYCFLTQFFGGPRLYIEKYGAPRMRMRHLPHKIDQKAMEAWLNCMQKAIGTLNLSKEVSEKLYNSFPKLAQHMVNH
ncbi:globin [Brumimicrobium salinarum]|uniref:Globin n=1 Tax=Brumimicrobium salinarum TaxID=2058658 RepID=A0A2I0R5Y3_9FLAO|nr:globin [Brumimicrobium salinarum]PKR81987.1 globin [Brumimicrobium salinarum]